MRTLPKIMLVVSTVLFLVSLTGPGSDVLMGGLKPISAILFIVFFISNLLPTSELRQFGEDNKLRDHLLKSKGHRATPAREAKSHSQQASAASAH